MQPFVSLGFALCLASQTLNAALPAHLLASEKTIIAVFQRAAPRVVNVQNHRYRRTGFFSAEVTEVPQGSGSGFLWDQSGHVVTNFHVVEGGHRVTASFGDGKTFETQLAGVEPRKDIAVLRLKGWTKKLGAQLHGFPLAVSSKVLVGQMALAIGSPFGLDQTLTTGIVSALGRSIYGIGDVTIRDMIQTDAPINPGNSGGPLLDSRGHLLGMNTMILSKSGSSSGVGFAVPASTIRRVVEQILRYGKVRQPGLGIMPFSDSIAQRLGVRGVVVHKVLPGSGAAAAGLRDTRRDRHGSIVLGDVVVAINSERVEDFDDLYNVLENKAIGSTVTVKVLRNRRPLQLKIKLMDLSGD